MFNTVNIRVLSYIITFNLKERSMKIGLFTKDVVLRNQPSELCITHNDIKLIM